jgi:glycosyltransferase involved in cell wall biosynthesis
MKLRVAFDATAIPGARAGAGHYVTGLLQAVDASDVDLHVFVKDADVEELASLLPHATIDAVKVGGRAARMAWGASGLPIRVRRVKPDVFHGPHYTLPRGLPVPGVVTFHDPTFFTHPKLHERKKVAYFRRAARAGVRRATRTVAVSEYAKRGAIEHAGAKPERVDVVYEGVDLERYRPANGARSSPAPYVLFVGTLEPRKNVPTLIAAFDGVDSPASLVLVGQPGWGVQAIEAAIAAAAKRDAISRTGYIDESELIELYRQASVFVYPSTAEGFGLPVVEALACGAPVVTTTGSAPEEIASGAALLVPPQDAGALRDAISRVLNDRSLAGALRKQGPERAARYTWDATARATTDVWRRAAQER